MSSAASSCSSMCGTCTASQPHTSALLQKQDVLGHDAARQIRNMLRYRECCVLQGEWSRLRYQQNPMRAGASTIKEMTAVLPREASSLYFRDEIGNVSTSSVRRLRDKTEVRLQPRFPLLGGWQVRPRLTASVCTCGRRLMPGLGVSRASTVLSMLLHSGGLLFLRRTTTTRCSGAAYLLSFWAGPPMEDGRACRVSDLTGCVLGADQVHLRLQCEAAVCCEEHEGRTHAHAALLHPHPKCPGARPHCQGDTTPNHTRPDLTRIVGAPAADMQ